MDFEVRFSAWGHAHVGLRLDEMQRSWCESGLGLFCIALIKTLKGKLSDMIQRSTLVLPCSCFCNTIICQKTCRCPGNSWISFYNPGKISGDSFSFSAAFTRPERQLLMQHKQGELHKIIKKKMDPQTSDKTRNIVSIIHSLPSAAHFTFPWLVPPIGLENVGPLNQLL